MNISIQPLSGADITPYLDSLATLRIQVFRDWPYLYDGSLDYERDYLQQYARSPQSLFVLARAGEQIVGAATGLPLLDAEEDFQAPFRDAGFDMASIFYFGESVLDPAWRGRGIGHAFFDEREAFARDQGYATTAFCAVVRPADHPARPAGYRPLDDFWRKRGYRPVDGLLTHFPWLDLGDNTETSKPMQFWLREL